MQQLEDDVFDIFTDVARFGESGRVGDRERHFENPRQRLGKQRLARAGRTDQQDVRLLQFDIAVAVLLRHEDALVVVVDGDSEFLLRLILPDDVLIKPLLDILRLKKREQILTGLLAAVVFEN